MLRQRVITALVLVAILLASLYANSLWPFAVLTLLLMAAGGWEWGRLNQAAPGAGLGHGRSGGAGRCCRLGRWLGLAGAGLAVGRGAGLVGGRRCHGPAQPARRPGRSCRARPAGRWVCWRCGWPGWRWRRRARVGINFMLSVLVPGVDGRRGGLLRRPRASAAASWRPASAPARAGKVCGPAWPACCCWPLSGSGWTAAWRRRRRRRLESLQPPLRSNGVRWACWPRWRCCRR